jgi:alpha-2-macroglobulin
MRKLFLSIFLALSAGAAMAQDVVPPAHVVISRDVDFPGGDLSSYFDTTLDACQAACLADDRCVAFTFNQKSNACFPKGTVDQAQPFQGALSGRVIATDPQVLAQAGLRVSSLSFLDSFMLDQARDLAVQIGRFHSSDEFKAADLIAFADEQRLLGDLMTAFKYTGAAVAVSDRADLWLAYGKLGQTAVSSLSDEVSTARARALPAFINAYLRAGQADAQADALYELAFALEDQGYGRKMIPALRLAQDIAPRRDVEAALERAIGLYGFNVGETQVDSDSATPRICVNFNEPLVQAGVDYAPFIQLPDAAFTVDVTDSQLCIDGVEHGKRYRLVLREGLPAASGEELARAVDLNLYVRDRSPAVRFTSRAYVLPRVGDVALPIETVNLTEVKLSLARVSDRNILRTMQEGMFAAPLYDWQQYYFDEQIGERIWDGTATVAQELNRDVLTRVPLEEALAGQPPGVYVLTAAVPGADPYETPASTQWFVLSDIGMATMMGNDGLTVVVRQLGDAAAMSGAEVTLLSQANAVLGTALTGDDGIARFEAGLTRGTGSSAPALVTVTDGADDLAFLSLTDPAFDLSDRGVEGREPAGPIDVFLTTDRGAYRAGEVIHLTALMRDDRAVALPGVPLTAVLTRPDGVEYSRIASTVDQAGGHVFELPVAASAPRGVWQVVVLADVDAPPLATSSVLVEDFLPERIDFDLNVAGPVRLGDVPQLDIAAKYLFGPPAADLPIEGDVILSAAAGLERFPGYVFGRYDETFQSVFQTLGNGDRTDEAGLASIAVALPTVVGGASQPLEARLNVRLSEGSGRPVERSLTVPVAPDLPMIGIRPAFADVVPEQGEARFSLIALAPDLTAQPMAVTWTVNRLETNYQWYNMYGNWNWEPSTTRSRVATGTAMLGADLVEIATPVDWGRYEIVVERTDGTYVSSAMEFYAGWYAPADAGATPDVLEASLDAPAYKVGDTAMLRIVPRFAGMAVVTVMSDRVIALQTVQVTEGENLIPVPVTDEWGPGAYLSATVIRPMDVAAGRNPARSLGVAYAPVDPGDKALNVTLTAPVEMEPRGPMEVGIDVQGVLPGETAYVTLAAVDVGILNLTAFQNPDPQGYYFGQRKLGVELRDIYGRLIDGMNGTMGTVRTGGDAMAQMNNAAPPPTEQLVAFFSGPVQIGPDGKATVTFDIPAFNGTVRLMAVAWSPHGVGQAAADVLVRDPVVVTASLPRFMAPGDQSRVLLEFVHASGPVGEMGLKVEADGLVLASQQLPQAFALTEGAKQVFSLPVGAVDPGVHTVTITVTTPDGKELVKVLTVPVQVNDPEVARTTRLTLAGGGTFTFDDNVFADLIDGTGSSTLSIGPLARLDAPGLLNVLDRYPYGCTEQLTSQAMPLLYFDDVIQAMGLADRADVALRIDQAVTEILANQSSNGAFGLWGPSSGDLWLDAYVTDFLSRAQARGHDVPERAFAMAVDNLRNQVNYYPDFESGGEALAYALMVLAREGDAAVGDLRYYVDERGKAFTSPLAAAQLGAALAFYGDQVRADIMFTRAADMIRALPEEPNASVWRVDYGTNRRDAAAVLALAVEAGSNAVDRDALTARIGGTGNAVSPQEAVWTLMAADALIDDLRETDLTINGAAPDGPLVWLRDAAVQAAPVAVVNTGTDSTEITVTTFGVPEQPEPAGGNGYAITRDYYTLDGETADVAQVAAGTRLVAVLTVQPFGRQAGRLMVNDPLPAGFEIDNPNLIRGGDLRGLEWLDPVIGETAEFRQERFLAAVNWDSDQPFQLAYIVRAISPGTFRHPAASVEDMYRPQMRARTETATITVTE